ncbi:hypothetical protein FJY94_04465 [Candidatus Kaiserbacteria bacterium]|nr:hypothetical protein [Candidatus Kaiserbacteria bacterium]
MIANPEIDLRDEQIVAQLHQLGVCHLVRLSADAPVADWPPAQLIAALAAHSQSRMRSALILLFLRQPEFGDSARLAVRQLDELAANTLRLYYQAAFYLQRELEPELRVCIAGWKPLPDLFSAELGLPPANTLAVETALQALGEIHHRLTGWAYNWAGAYRQDIPLFLKQLRRFLHEPLIT